MKKLYHVVTVLMFSTLIASGQSYITPQDGYKVAYFFSETNGIQALDVGSDYFYFSTGDTIYQADPFRQELSNRYVRPADYNLFTFPSFLCLSPDESTLWAGYTDLDNADARIYSIDAASGAWNLEARMPSNFDLAFWNDSILVSGLNSADFNSPNAIYVLDTSGNDLHRLIIETGGSSAGLAVDAHGNLYYGTSFLMDPNGLYRWDSAQVASVVETPGADPLQLSDAVKLSDLCSGACDCEVDAGDHVVFNLNTWGGTQVTGSWNNIPGDGYNYDTLATSSEWLGQIKSRGDHTIAVPGNSLFTLAYDQAVADLHSCDYPPVQVAPLPVICGYETEAMNTLDLYRYICDLDDPGGFDYIMTFVSEPSVASVNLDGSALKGTFGSAGQSNLVLVASSAGKNVRAETLIATWPEAEEGLLVSDFGELLLDAESYWNGSDGSGHFSSGPARFFNNYNSEYVSWSGWAYSNTSDVLTPGYLNQFSAVTGEGFHGEEDFNQVYGVSSLYGPSVVGFNAVKAFALDGFFVTNSTYASLSMLEGDTYAKAFGGTDGSDPDFFRLLAWGMRKGSPTDTVEFYLADYRFENNDRDYIIRTWQWVDLSSLGKVDSLMFGLESSDTGDWGMNTPAYFCMDNLMVRPDAPPFVAHPMADISIINNDSTYVFDISELFSDPDDDDSDIVKEVIANSNVDFLYAAVSGNTLNLRGKVMLTKSTFEEVQIVLEGRLGGLSARDTVLVRLEFLNGLEDEPPAQLRIYPNPSHGQFVIGSESGEPMDVRVYNMRGALVYSNKHVNAGETIELTGQAAGVYMVRIKNSRCIIDEKIQIR